MAIVARVILGTVLAVLLAGARAEQEAEEVAPEAEVAEGEQTGAEQSEDEEAKEEEQAKEEDQAKAEEEEEEKADREECHMQLMPFRAEEESGTPRDSAILVDGCTGESMMLRLGSWKNGETGELEKIYYWVRIPRANPRRFEDLPASR